MLLVGIAMLVAGCAGTKDASRPPVEQRNLVSRPLGPEEIVLDYSAAAQVLALWREHPKSIREQASAIAADIPYLTLREFLTTQMSCVATDREIARAIEFPDSGICGFGLEPAYRERAALDSLLSTLVERSTGIRERMAGGAGAYMPRTPWRPIHVMFVVSSRWLFDAVTLDEGPGGKDPVVLFNLSEALEYGGDNETRAATVEHVLAHETFHAALRQIEDSEPGWERYHSPRNAFDFIARVMLDEGVAHYVDWKGRPGADTLFAAKVSTRERKAFDQLALACKRLRDPRTDPGSRSEILGLASTGPLWSKYGAISGMFAAWRIERAWGADSLRALVVSGPMAMLRAYAAVAASDTSLRSIPRDLFSP